jgi:hypothetical protein
MSVSVSNVRTELQLSANVISDADIEYVINKLLASDDINLVCADVLRMTLRKHRGLAERRIGKYNEVFSPLEIRKQINEFIAKAASGSFDDGFEHPEAWFTRDGI